MSTVHDLVQGSPEWHTFRLEHFGASEAAAMLGISTKLKRSELLRMKHTGNAKEFSDWVQKNILDRGHQVEAMCRPLIAERICEDLYPLTYSNGKLSASCDGITMGEEVAWEHKQWNAALAASVAAGVLPDEYIPQTQQIMMVTPAKKVIFTVSDGTLQNEVSMDVSPDGNWQAKIRAGWEQFEKDLAEYVPEEIVVPAVAAPQMSLPAVSIQVNGSIALVDNLDKFGAALSAYIARINKKPETDQDFADLEATVKTLKNAEEALDGAENGALGQTQSIDSMRRTVAVYRETARTNRLLVEKLVKAEKENRRTAIVSDAVAAIGAHVTKLNERLGRGLMPVVDCDFHGVIKGLKSLDSMKDKVSVELARAKISANAMADNIQLNLATLREHASEYKTLFHDTAQMVLKPNDMVMLMVKQRIADHLAAEAAKEEETRARIRAEEQAKAEKDARYKIAVEQEAAAAKASQARLDEQARQFEEQERSEIARREQLNKTLIHEVPYVAPAEVATAPAANVVAMPARAPAAAPVPATPPSLKLGQIAERLGFSLTADFLKSLGFEPAATYHASKLYHEHDFTHICAALIQHINNVQASQAA